ncbi:hypothetical protein [Mesoterricola silvestris]|uniref:Uncharacterized protein n=1 Tax=Mesoterricola silvestris TaxID=2927979 RepID=A0AA48K8U5_9BACT|nr:hypothetical protein [Mesoterricola silvestris]BDU72711.1 hypothetical protein METEAL_18850 [Mesoterricola silvestris]
MKRSTRPYVPVLLSEMEIHWLITQHDQIIKAQPGTCLGFAKGWNETRRGQLLSAWDQTGRAQ